MGHRVGNKGPEHYNWKGGRVVNRAGYVMIKVGRGHHLASPIGYALEHRLVAERMLGRRLTSEEVVHHIDGNKQNNDPANLEVLPSAAHHAHEHGVRTDRRAPDEPNPEIICACGCGEGLAKYDDWGRPRKRIPGHSRWLSPERRQSIRAARAAGASLSEAAAMFGVPIGVIRRAAAGIQNPNWHPLSQTQKEEIRQSRRAGASLGQLARRFGTSKSVVARCCKTIGGDAEGRSVDVLDASGEDL